MAGKKDGLSFIKAEDARKETYHVNISNRQQIRDSEDFKHTLGYVEGRIKETIKNGGYYFDLNNKNIKPFIKTYAVSVVLEQVLEFLQENGYMLYFYDLMGYLIKGYIRDCISEVRISWQVEVEESMNGSE